MEKVFLPIKTKIAAMWMRVIGVISFLLIAFIILSLSGVKPASTINQFFIMVRLFSTVLLVIFPFFLFKERRWACLDSIFIIFLIILLDIIILPQYFLERGITSTDDLVKTSLFFLFLNFPPLILLLLDRKNFWKIAT